MTGLALLKRGLATPLLVSYIFPELDNEEGADTFRTYLDLTRSPLPMPTKLHFTLAGIRFALTLRYQQSRDR